jgi:hypothetical protein
VQHNTLHEFSSKLIMNENSSRNDNEFEIVDGMEDHVMILKRTDNESKNNNWLPWLVKRCKLH